MAKVLKVTKLTFYEHGPCMRCGKKFTSKFKNPKRCGKCVNRGWNKPRVRAPKQPKMAIA